MKAASKKRRSNKAPSAKQLAARRKFAAAAKARSKAAKAARPRKRNKTIIKKALKVIVLNPGTVVRRKVRNSHMDLVIRGTAEKTAKGWKVGRKVIAQGKGITPISSGYYLDKATGTIFAKRARNKAAKKRNSAKTTPKIKAIAESFSGRKVRSVSTLNVSEGSPKNLAKLGKLVLIETQGGTIKPASGTTWLCADAKGKLHLATSAASLYDGGARNFGKVLQVEYEASKPHLGHSHSTIFSHEMGEEGGKKPVLIADGKGGLKFRGGSYRITREGIVN